MTSSFWAKDIFPVFSCVAANFSILVMDLHFEYVVAFHWLIASVHFWRKTKWEDLISSARRVHIISRPTILLTNTNKVRGVFSFV